MLGSPGLKITIETNLTSAGFLDVTLDLDFGIYRPYRKLHERLPDINRASCYPSIVFKNLAKDFEPFL